MAKQIVRKSIKVTSGDFVLCGMLSTCNLSQVKALTLQLYEGGLVYILTRKVRHTAMRGLMVMPSPVQGPNPLLLRNDTTSDDWNGRCRMDASPNW